MENRRKFLKETLAISPFVFFPRLVIRDNNLPKVLLLGDSISIGYTPFVQEGLKNKALVLRPVLENGTAENCQGTTNGIKNIKRWIGDGSWDVIHFNFGLHDLKHVEAATGKNSDDPDSPLQANPKIYKANLERIVAVLLKTGAKLIFATTTPYPGLTRNPLRDPGMPEKYNKVALKIMLKNGIAVNDLYTFAKPRLSEIQLPNNVHFTEGGYRELAQKVIDRISDALPE